jgi:hypothetical protein
MYEFSQKFRRTSRLQGLGVDDVTPGQQLALDYRAGAKTMSEVQGICLGVSSVDRYHTDYDECRWFLTPEDLCFRENGNRECTEAQLRQQCFMTPANLRHNRCFFYMDNMSAEEAQASNAGPETGASALQRAAGVVAGYRERVAQAAEDVVRSVRPVDANVQAIQRAVLAGGCVLPRYGADGRWGGETETGVRCLAQRQGWNTVMMQYPWLAQRIQVPAQQVADASSTAKPSGVVASITQILPAVSAPTPISAASIFSSFGIGGVPSWAPWAIAGAGLLSVMALGFYIARSRR